jgi:hypothetical protein
MKLKTLLLLYAFLLLASGCLCQTVSPVVQECGGKKCSGQFTVTNNTLGALMVSVEPLSFSLTSASKSVLRPLDAGITVRLSEMSARLSPKESHIFEYHIQCAALPCLVQFNSYMVVGHTTDGIAVRLALPEVVYYCQKEKNCRQSVRLAAGISN